MKVFQFSMKSIYPSAKSIIPVQIFNACF